jgi:hypothetical protein
MQMDVIPRNPDGTLKPGAVLNPNGLRNAKPISAAIRALMTRPETDRLDDEPLTNAQRIALEWARKARAGELAAIISISDRIEGRPAQAIEHSGDVDLTHYMAHDQKIIDRYNARRAGHEPVTIDNKAAQAEE